MAGGAGGGVWAVLVAAGRGERLASKRPKAFAKLRDRPLLAESVERLEASEWVDAIVVVAPPDWEEPSILVAEEVAAGKVVACVTGRATRLDSVRAGIEEVPDDAAIVLVHDAARPLLPLDVVDRVLAPLGEGFDGAVPGLPVPDTLKRVEGDAIVETVSRDGLYTVQTPQAFLAEPFRRALEGFSGEATDCAGVVEANSGRVAVVVGDRRLVKVTTSADLALVETLLAP